MAEKRYRVIGRVPVPTAVLTDRQVGDEFEADLDKSLEDMLVGAGALEIVAKSVKRENRETKQADQASTESKQAPKGHASGEKGASK